ncbi:uncharacterized protein LOC111135135 isoform X8 [Crassostrea virginica]
MDSIDSSDSCLCTELKQKTSRSKVDDDGCNPLHGPNTLFRQIKGQPREFESRTYWVESTYVSPPLQTEQSSIKIKLKSCRNDRIMEKKKRGRKAGFKAMRDNTKISNFGSCDDILFIDKFSLIKARRHRLFQKNARERTVPKSNKTLGENRKYSVLDIVTPSDDRIEISETSEVQENESNETKKRKERELHLDQLTIDLKRIGIDPNVDRIEDELLASNISCIFKKTPNVSIPRIDQEHLNILNKDGFIKTGKSDKTITEDRSERMNGISQGAQKKPPVITSEDLNKLKSKLKTVSYYKTKPHLLDTDANFESHGEAPNLIEETQITLFSQCQEGLQPPTLTPQKNCTLETPIVYYETKPDVTELNLLMAAQRTSSDSSEKNEEFSEREYDRVMKYSKGSHCRQLDVFVCRSSLEDDDTKEETDSVGTTDSIPSEQQKSSEITLPTETTDSLSTIHSDESSEESSVSLVKPSVKHTDSAINSSLSHSENVPETSSSVHAIAHFTTDNTSLDLVPENIRSLSKEPSEGTLASQNQQIRKTSKNCEQTCINYHNENDIGVYQAEVANASEYLSNDATAVALLPEKGHYRTPSVDLSNTNSSSGIEPCHIAKEPIEAACVNGYDSDATLVYDEEENEKVEENVVKEKAKKCNVFSSLNTQSMRNCGDIQESAEIKETVSKTLSSNDSLTSCTTLLKTQKTKSGKEKGKTARKVLKIKFKTKGRTQRKSMTGDIGEDLTLTISPRKHKRNGKLTNEHGNDDKKNTQNGMKLHDIFHFEDFDENKIDIPKRPASKNQSARKRNPERKRGRKMELGLPSRRRRNKSATKKKIFEEFVNIDEDDLPKILPPKRRRHAKSDSAMKTKPELASNDMERLIQEFPRHNWLENKYKSEDAYKDTPRENHTSPELYEYSLDGDENMECIDKNEGKPTEENQVINNTSDDHDDRSGSNQAELLDPGSQVTPPTSTSAVDEQEDLVEEDRLHIVTDSNTDGKDQRIMIPCAEYTTMSDIPSPNPDNNLESTSCSEQVPIQQQEPSAEGDTTQDCSPSVEVPESSKTTDNNLPPVPHLIKMPEKNQDDMSSWEKEDSIYSDKSISTAKDPITVNTTCTSGVDFENESKEANESCVHSESSITITSNINCVVSPKPFTNTRKRRYLDSNGSEHGGLPSAPTTPDHVQVKSPKIQCSPNMDLDNFKEIITAKVKNDINNQLQKTLKEVREIDQMALAKAREVDALKQLREQKLKDLQIIQQNNSETEIKRILNDRLRYIDRQNEKAIDMSSPPPAHQRPKQNIRELLDKMDRSHSQTPIDCSTFSAFSTRKTPLHSPSSSYDTKSLSKPVSPMLPSRTEASMNCSGDGSFPVPIAHVTEQNCDMRASSAPALCYSRNVLSKSSFSDVRPLVPQTVSVAASNSRTANGVKSSVVQHGTGNGFIDLSQSNGDSEVEIQRELSRALAAKRQKQDSNVSKSKEELYSTKQTFQASSIQPAVLNHNANPKDIMRGTPQFPQNTYSNQAPRAVLYGGMGSPQNLPMDRSGRSVVRHGMMRPHAVRLLGAAAVGNGHQTVDGRAVYHSHATGIPISTFQNTGSIQQGTPIRPMPGIVNPTRSNTRPPFPNGTQGLENSQRLRHIPITAARTTDEAQKAPHIQQAAVYTQPPAIRPRPHFRPLAPVSSARVQPIGTPRIASSKTTPPSTEVVYPQISQQSQPSMHLNVNGKCIVCSKFALYLCSKCQQFWYCSPQCQLKHWVTHQHNCKNSSNVS